jgi:polyisoprenoid-binding protein YceI
MRRAAFIVLALVFWLGPASLRASSWDIDPTHTRAQFAVRHLMVSTVRGDFGKISGVLTLDEQDSSKSMVEATIDVTSLGHARVQTGRTSEECGFLRCGQIPDHHFQID